MSAPHVLNSHPRRRPIKGQVSPLSTHGMSLRKSGTFSSPKSLSTDICGLENHPFMPRRSPTSTEGLEALLEQDASLSRISNLLKTFDETLSGSASGVNILKCFQSQALSLTGPLSTPPLWTLTLSPLRSSVTHTSTLPTVAWVPALLARNTVSA
jgi:hypothetical protein